MNLWRKFKELNSGDATPGFTKFTTLYVMPLVIATGAFGLWYISEILDSTLSDYGYVRAKVKELEFREHSNKKPVETIRTDFYLIIYEGEVFIKKNIGQEPFDKISKALNTGDSIEIYFSNMHIKELRKGEEVLISFSAELERHKRGRIVISFFFFCFLIWYLSRIYRYRKYGTI